jgi:O-succinylbenzoate synthase
MLKFSSFRYSLEPVARIGALAPANPRKGSLLKIQWPDGLVGYADLHPWPELGDPDINQQLEDLKSGKMTELVEQAIWLARLDAKARSEKKSLFDGLPKVKNHFLITDFQSIKDSMIDEIRSAGFATFKIKVGIDPFEESKFVSRLIRQHPIMVRLDFNSTADFQFLQRFVSLLTPPEKAKIEFVEDPFPWDPTLWSDASKLVPLAIDHEITKINWDSLPEKSPFKFVVVKPARMDVQKTLEKIVKHDLKMVVTSSLDHPVGVAHALAVASEFKKTYPARLADCGCLTNRAYKANSFSAQFITNGPFLVQPLGTGIGFDEILSSLNWESVQ